MYSKSFFYSISGGRKMKKFVYVILAVILIGVTALSGCGGEKSAETPIELRFATFIPPTDVYAVNLGEWAKELEEKTNGRLKVTFFHAQSLLKMPEMLDGVASGTADMAFFNAGIYPDRLPLSQIMGLPIMMFETSAQAAQTWWDIHNKYKEHQDEYTKAGVKALWFQMPGPNQLEGNKRIETLNDLNGLKVAVDTREEIEAFKLLGAAPVLVAGGDKYISLETNVVNSSTQNFNGSKTWKTHQVAKYITENVDISYRICPTIINLDTYNSFPADIKKIFDEVSNGAVWTKRAALAYDESNAKYRTEIEDYHKAAGDPAIFRLPDSEKAKWRDMLVPIKEGWTSGVETKGLPGKAIFADVEVFAQKYK